MDSDDIIIVENHVGKDSQNIVTRAGNAFDYDAFISNVKRW